MQGPCVPGRKFRVLTSYRGVFDGRCFSFSLPTLSWCGFFFLIDFLGSVFLMFGWEGFELELELVGLSRVGYFFV